MSSLLNFFPTKGESPQSEDHHVRRDSRLQEALESANRTVLPGTMRTNRATVRLPELRERLLSEPAEICKRMVSTPAALFDAVGPLFHVDTVTLVSMH
jgi:hypothetical protein